MTYICMRSPCPSPGCPYCQPGPLVPVYTYPPIPISQPAGCICPPTSEKTCQSPMCPRKNHLQSAGASLAVSQTK